MNFYFSALHDNRLNNMWLLTFRVILSVFMLTHGLSKLKMLLEGNGDQFSDPIGIGSNLSLVLAVCGEVLGPLLIIPGIVTRLATIPTVITMVVAAFIVHGDDPFKNKEMALLYLSGFITIMILGPGRYSLDHLIFQRKIRVQKTH